MSTTNEDRTWQKSGGALISRKEFARIPEASDTFGIPRTRFYNLAAAGKIKMVKMGGVTLVDCASVRDFLATLPPADIRSVA